MRDLIAVIVCLLLALPARADVLVDDFEDVTDWSGLDLDAGVAVQGAASGRWDAHPDQTSVSKQFASPVDASGQDTLSAWVHSAVANGAEIELIFDSENPASDGWDYYRATIVLDWTGWRHLWIPLADFSVAREPVGWHALNRVQLSASGWDHEPMADSLVHLDDMRLTAALIDGVTTTHGYEPGGDFVYTHRVAISEKAGAALAIDLVAELAPDSAWQAAVTPGHLDLAAHQAEEVVVELRLAAANIMPEEWLQSEQVALSIQVGGLERDRLALTATVPLPARPAPRLLLDAAGIARAQTRATDHAWAQAVVAAILDRADDWPAAHNDRYGLASWELPPEGGQWTLWYVCPEHGVRLTYEGPGRNICPVDGQNHTGWPFDQVIYAWRHSDSARAAQDLGLAYRLSGDVTYAQAASEILLAYADAYLGYPIHDKNGDQGRSGARVGAQTLDESGWLISMAWAYDLVAHSPALTDADRLHIEQDLLREAVAVIQRNDAGMSNWQSWHNAAIAAVGFGLEDPRLTAEALWGVSGFDFQMEHSVTDDGLWYEGAWGYHFYALDPLMQTALMGELAGLDVFAYAPLHDMFGCAVRFAMPDMTLPPFNDSSRTDLTGRRGFYEVAFARYGEAELAVPLSGASRGREALFWGVDEPPSGGDQDLGSLLFPDAGFAVLRAGQGAASHYLALDYGPHGGWHGHFDKLGFVSFAQGDVLGLDPGTQSYAAPTHTTWDKVSLAHNTVVIDETSQAEAEGQLLRAVLLPGVGFARASAGPVYPEVADLERTMALVPDYALDVFEVQALDGLSHPIDLVYHNPGTAVADRPLSDYGAFPDSEGYQHLSGARAAAADDGFAVTFDMEGDGEPAYGRVWANDAAISGSFSLSRDQSASGTGSGRLHYDFSAAQGYILYTTAAPEAIAEVPADLRLQVHGDGSGHELRLRVMDATDERFTTTVGPIDWSGWRTITAQDIPGWSHYLGNDDGLVDTPLGAVVIELRSDPAGPATGDIYVDDVVLIYPDAGVSLVADFERPYRALTWQLAPEAGTSLVVGHGLGPDLQVPVPFAMARRQADRTTFASIYEPHGATRQVTAFEPLGVDAPQDDAAFAFRVQAADWEDFWLLVGAGEAGLARTAGERLCDGQLCYARRAPDGRPLALALGEGAAFFDQGVALIDGVARLSEMRVDREADALRVQGELRGAQVRILAPGVTEVSLNGGPVDWEADGDHVVLNPGGEADGGPDAGPDAGDEDGADGSADAGADAASDAGSDAGTDAGTDAGADPGVTDDDNPGVDGGCGCATRQPGQAAWLLLLMLGLGLPRRR